ncbi:carbon-nitrogen hydrolase [Cellvibrio sp. OA-2007]|uniref:carbon-nitrogen hydrolase n=1 Tax=Cellvibrio sp. OA-2007 TaxID=529823 RepID=UPI000782F3C2|nr:carbon-nitrogen hydrolase [Cellvibrio sp. OA-2007]
MLNSVVKTLQVGLVQQSCTADLAANLAKSIAQIRIAAQQGAKLVVLQELHRGLYFCQQEMAEHFDLAETIPGPSTQVLGALAQELDIVIVASLFEKRAVGLHHNTAVVIECDGTIAGKYRKMHIPDDPGYYEKFYFTPGDLGFQPIQTSVGKLGILVCWDQWFPEAARLMAMAGAELLIYPTAIGWAPDEDADEKVRQRDAWVTVQRAHAIANGLPVISVNRVGHEADPAGGVGLDFWGSSFVTGPQGEFLFSASVDQEETKVVTVDLQRSEQVRRMWPYLRDRRIDHYGELIKIYRD